MISINLTEENFKDIELMIEYLLDSEKNHYEESFCETDDINVMTSEEQKNHIYAITMRVKAAINLSIKNKYKIQ